MVQKKNRRQGNQNNTQDDRPQDDFEISRAKVVAGYSPAAQHFSQYGHYNQKADERKCVWISRQEISPADFSPIENNFQAVVRLPRFSLREPRRCPLRITGGDAEAGAETALLSKSHFKVARAFSDFWQFLNLRADLISDVKFRFHLRNIGELTRFEDCRTYSLNVVEVLRPIFLSLRSSTESQTLPPIWYSTSRSLAFTIRSVSMPTKIARNSSMSSRKVRAAGNSVGIS